MKLRNSSPAPTSSTSASAISTTTNALRTRAPRAADPERPPSFSVSVRFAPADVQRRRDAEDEPLTSAAAIVKSEHLAVDADLSSRAIGSRSRDRRAAGRAPTRRAGDPASAADGGEQQALGEHLPDQPAAAGAERRADRQLALRAPSPARAPGCRRSRTR